MGNFTSVLHLNFIYKVSALAMLLFVTAPSLYAQTQGAEQGEKTKLDMMILMDSSGSMLVTDPQRLRDRGVELFAERLSADDRVGLVKFAEDAKLVLPLNSFTASLPKILQAELSRVESTGTYTNLYAGIEVAAKQLLSSVRDDATPILVLLSDGKMEPPPQFGEAQAISKKLVDDLLPDLRAKNIRIYTLSFSDQADRDLLAQIAKATDAASWFTPSVDKLQRSFEDLLVVLKKTTPAPNRSKGLLIEHDVEDATFYLDRAPSQELKLISPTGQSYKFDAKPEDVRWHKGADFDVVTIPAPAVGTWSIEGYGEEEGFAAVLPELGVTVSLPPVIRAESPLSLSVSLVNRRKPIALTKMLELISFEFEITPTDRVSEPVVKGTLSTKPDGASVNQAVAKESVKLDQVGEYSILVKAVGPTFRREQSATFVVKPPLITLHGISKKHSLASHDSRDRQKAEHNDSHDIDTHATDTHETAIDLPSAPGDSHGEGDADEGKSGHLQDGEEMHPEELVGFEIALHPDALKYKDISVNVLVIDSRSNRRELKAERVISDPRRYKFNLDELAEDGDYTGVAILRALSIKGEQIETESLPVEFKFSKERIAPISNKDEQGDPHGEVVHGEHGAPVHHDHEHQSSPETPVTSIILATALADLLGLLIVWKLMGLNKIKARNKIEESPEGSEPHLIEAEDVSQQSELDELKAFANRVDMKVRSQEIDPLDTAYDDIVMRLEERLAAEDLAELTSSSQENQASQEEHLKKGEEQ